MTQHIILSGIYNSGPTHWQSLWMQEDPKMLKLEHRSWTHPDRDEWVHELNDLVQSIEDDMVFIAHSLGCLMVAHWAALNSASLACRRVRGALLVAVPDPSGPHFPVDAKNFYPATATQLPFKSMVVASTNDPYGSQEYMETMAHAWGSSFVSLGQRRHINADSGLGTWPQGKEFLQGLLY